MGKYFNIIDSFTTGEVSPKLRGRVDLDQYNNGCRTLQNFTIHPHGGITRRTGSEYVAEIKDSSAESRLIPFEFSTTQTYILEFGNQYIRFYKDQAQILDSEAITNGTFDSDISGWTDNSDGTGAVSFNTDHMDLVSGTSGNEAKAYQALTLGTNQYTITATTNATLTYNIGTTAGGTEIATGTINGTAQTFNFTPSTQGTVYIEFENATASSTVTLDDVSISNPAYQIDTPYTTAQLSKLQYAQSADVMYIVHPSHEVMKLSRTGHDDWTLEEVVFVDGPFLDENITDTYFTVSDVTGSVTVTASAITGINSNTGFQTTDIGRFIRFFDGVNWTYLKITARASTTSVTATIIGNDIREPVITGVTQANPGVVTTSEAHNLSDGDFVRISEVVGMTELNGNVYKVNNVNSTTFELQTTAGVNVNTTGYTAYSSAGVFTEAPKNWRLGAFSDTSGHPQAVSFHEQRLLFAGTSYQPQTLWGSLSGGIENFSPDNPDNDGTVDDDTAYTFTIASTQANVIHWLASRQQLFLGTSGGIFVAQASSLSEAITPSNITIKPAVNTGAKQALPINAQNATIFIQSFGKKLMELGFLFEEDSFNTADLTILSEHITGPGIKELARQEEPDEIVWAITTDGQLLGLTYLRRQKVVGWHQHVIGGTGVEVESIATIPGATQNELWMIVKRTINGGTKRYVEFLSETFDGTKADAWFVDSGLSFTSSTTASITGITKANPGVVTTSAAHGFSNGDVVELTGIGGMTELNGFRFTIANVTSTTFELQNRNTSSYTTYTSGGTATKLATTISGLDHLEGESVSVLGDQATHPNVTVSSGAITLTRAVKSAIIGLGYTSILETNDIEQRGPLGTIQGSIGRIYKAIIRFHDTLGGKFGYDTSNLDTILFRDGDDLMDSSPGLYTGDKTLEFPRGQETSQRITVQQDQPLPMTILAIILKGQSADA